AVAKEPTTLLDPLESRDSALMVAALKSLGTSIHEIPNGLLIEPNPLRGPAYIDCGLAGTVMRFVPPLASIAEGKVSFDGDEAAKRRPMKTTIDSLRSLGVEIEGEGLPFNILGKGKVRGGEINIDASASSQFVSGLLLVAARFDEGLTLNHVGDHLPSAPHIKMTLDCLRKRGVDAQEISQSSWRIVPGEISGGTIRIEPDLSNAGPFLAAAMVAGGSVTIPNWPESTTQVGDQFDGILQQLGAKISKKGGALTIFGSGEIHGIDIDLSEAGELTPVIAALAALADSKTTIRGVAHLRGHETDRLKALVSEINSLGGKAEETADGMIIEPAKLQGGIWRCYEDHRMATAGAIIGLRVPGVEIEDVSVTSKTMPNFKLLWERMLEEKA
ncbi:MAG: 3-phosphoshikimate 1-carboxyvinyltransferase, partial [Actinomycetota bacterium]